MRVRGIDPGSHELSWCDLDCHEGGPADFVAMGTASAATGRDMIASLDPSIYVVTIEIAYELDINPLAGPAQVRSRAAQVLATNRCADRIIEACRYRGVRAFEVDDATARRGVGVQFHRGGKGEGRMTVDKQIGIIVRGLIRGFPPKRQDSNPDKRDAAVYALHGGYLLSVERRDVTLHRDDHGAAWTVQPPGTYGPGDYGPDSFGGSDH